MRKSSEPPDDVSTLYDFAPGCLFEELLLGHNSLRPRALTNGDFDHGRGEDETRPRKVPIAIADR